MCMPYSGCVLTGQNEIDDVHDALITRQSYIERHWTCPIKIFVLHSKVGWLVLVLIYTYMVNGHVQYLG